MDGWGSLRPKNENKIARLVDATSVHILFPFKTLKTLILVQISINIITINYINLCRRYTVCNMKK